MDKPLPPRRKALTPSDFLSALRSRGVRRIRCVRFRQNRSTVWSITQNGSVLNVHSAFATAPPRVIDAFATVAREGGIGSRKSREAARVIGDWPGLLPALEEARESHAERKKHSAVGTHCCATEDQRRYLRSVYRYFNQTRFGGRLPDDVPVRLSRRMRSSLGHMLPGERRDGTRYVIEIAINCDLMLPGNGAERADTILHEMAHVADWLESGGRGHGDSWRAWAKRVGCRPTTLYDRPVRYRRNRRRSVDRVPPLPAPVARL